MEIEGKKKKKTLADYQADYYRRNKAAIAAKKRRKYLDDPEYRNSLITNAKRRKKRLMEEKRAAIERGDIPKRKPMGPKQYKIAVAGEIVMVFMYSPAQLGKFLGRTAAAIRMWERQGMIPEALYKTPKGHRLYTAFQVRKIKEALLEAKKVDGIDKVKNRITKTIFPKLLKEIWRDYPAGILPSEVTKKETE